MFASIANAGAAFCAKWGSFVSHLFVNNEDVSFMRNACEIAKLAIFPVPIVPEILKENGCVMNDCMTRFVESILIDKRGDAQRLALKRNGDFAVSLDVAKNFEFGRNEHESPLSKVYIVYLCAGSVNLDIKIS